MSFLLDTFASITSWTLENAYVVRFTFFRCFCGIWFGTQVILSHRLWRCIQLFQKTGCSLWLLSVQKFKVNLHSNRRYVFRRSVSVKIREEVWLCVLCHRSFRFHLCGSGHARSHCPLWRLDAGHHRSRTKLHMLVNQVYSPMQHLQICKRDSFLIRSVFNKKRWWIDTLNLKLKLCIKITRLDLFLKLTSRHFADVEVKLPLPPVHFEWIAYTAWCRERH